MTSPVAHSQKASTRSHERERSFTIEQFQALVASALDIQRVPDSDLAFSFGGDTYPPPTCSTRSRRSNGARSIRSVTLTRLKGAFAKKFEPTDASLPVPPESRRAASSSAPSLAICGFGGNYQRSAFSVQTPSDSTSLPATSLAPFGSYDGFENRSCAENFHAPDIRPEGRKYSSARSFLNLKPLIIPELSRKASRKLFSSGTLPTPPSEPSSISSNSSPTVDSSYADTDALRSFFDDSGYEEDLHALKAAKKSKTSLRSLCLSSQHGNNKGHSAVPSAHGGDKALLPTPATGNRPLAQYKEATPMKDSLYTHENVSFDRGSLFYTPPIDEQSLSDLCDIYLSPDQPCKEARSKEEARARRASNLIIGTSSSERKIVSRGSRNSPPPYPSPTSPLPPTPDLSAISTLVSSSHGQISPRVPDGVGETSEDSIDSTEILSWRMPNLDRQVSPTSTSSSAQAHALGRPSRGSIRERLGLGPRLHLHVPTPAEFLSGSSKMPKSRERLSSESTIRAHRPPSRTNSPKLPLQRLTSASLVSFKSIATITAAGKGIDEEAFCFVRREEALAVDRAFTPEDDPFAADPLTPITPITPVFETQFTKIDKYRSFMPLGNPSVSPELPICVLPSWHYRLGSNANKSSPALTPSSPYRDHPNSTPKRSRLSAAPSGVLHKQLPLPVVDGQNLKRALPSIPIDLSGNQLDLDQTVIKVQNYRKLQQEDLNNRRDESEEGDSQVVGHSESRPHSPFPLLFEKSNATRTVPAVARDSRRSSMLSAISKATSERSARCMPTTQPAGRLVESCRIRHGECIEEPRSLSAKDIDAFGDAARNFTLDSSSREIVSPTAWLLELDDYDDGFKNSLKNDAPTGGSNILELDLHSETPIHAKFGARRYDEGRKLHDRPMNLEGNNYGHSSPPRVFHPAESEAETEGNASILRASQCWPLPPNDTVVVDEENRKVYHATAPDIQYIKASSASRSLKYSIRSPEKVLEPAVSENRDYRRSSNSSSHSNELTNSQGRAIVEQCRQPSGYKNSVPAGSPSSYKPHKSVSSHQLKQRSRSTTSLASVGGFSVRTSRSAYYSARSTVSRGSDKSTFSFPRQVGASSREGSIHSASSSRSPASSGDHGCRSSTVHLDSDSSCVPPYTSSSIGFPVSRDF